MFELVLLAPEERPRRPGRRARRARCLSVSVEDADAATDAEQALFGEPGMPAPGGLEPLRVVALFQQEQQAREAAELLRRRDFLRRLRSRGVRLVADQDWVRLTQSQFAPVEITPTFWIVPSWHEPPAAAEKVIRLDPGLAFGTGTHPTTRMCLRWTAQRDRADSACSTTAAVRASWRSARPSMGSRDRRGRHRSGGGRIDADQRRQQPREPAGRPADLAAQGEFDLVLANILATPLKVLAPLLCSHVRAGGHLVLRASWNARPTNSYGLCAWLALEVTDSEDGWILMTARAAA